MIDGELGLALKNGEPRRLTSGQKKDVVVGQLVKPGKVVIYGWHRPDGTPIQPRTTEPLFTSFIATFLA